MLRIGSRGPETLSWQGLLQSQGYSPGTIDGVFGAGTADATKSFQKAHGLEDDGVVGPATYRAALEVGWKPLAGDYPGAEFVPARWFTPSIDRDVQVIVIHTTEGQERPRQAKNTAAWFADERSRGSAHYTVDPEIVVQSVLEKDIAWHSGHKGTNSRSIGVEHCGRADQTPEQWEDATSTAELIHSSVLVAHLCSKYSIPVAWLTVKELKEGRSGLCGHKLVTDAFNAGKGHYDPGPSFPVARYLDLVLEQMTLEG